MRVVMVESGGYYMVCVCVYRTAHTATATKFGQLACGNGYLSLIENSQRESKGETDGETAEQRNRQ
jgi:hypothetical protein